MQEPIILKNEKRKGTKLSKETMLYGVPILMYFLVVLLSNLNLAIAFLMTAIIVLPFIYIYYINNILKKEVYTLQLLSDCFTVQKEIICKGKVQKVWEEKVYYGSIRYIKEDWKTSWEYDGLAGKNVTAENIVVSKKDKAFIYLFNEHNQLCGRFEVLSSVGVHNFRYFIKQLLIKNPSIQLSGYVERML